MEVSEGTQVTAEGIPSHQFDKSKNEKNSPPIIEANLNNLNKEQT
jgi:hypothetical protein